MSFTLACGPSSQMAPGPSTIVLSLRSPLARAEVRALCEEGRALLESSGAEVLVCDASALATSDAVAVDAIARLQLTARRLGSRICIREPPADLCSLLRFTGLAEVCGLRAELERQAEEREQPLRVEEERELDDPPG